MDKDGILMEKYEVGRLLGQGTFAKVYYARDIKTAQSVAIKVIDKDRVLRAGLMDQIKREIMAMKLVKHPNIVELHEVMASKSKIFVVMEYVKGGELFSKVAKGRLKEDQAQRYFQQLINAVEFCHSRGVFHRDLKPENLLLDENGNIKVTDFGLCALNESRLLDGFLHTSCGTPAYVAPEVLCRKGYDGGKVDIWSCGVILFVMLAGYLPFHDANLMEMYKKIAKAEFRCPNWISSEARRLLTRILDPNPNTRISIAGIRESLWFRDKKKMPPTPRRAAVEAHVHDISLKPTKMNAFDIISISEGFDLSGLFKKSGIEKVQFISGEAAEAVVRKLEAAARQAGMRSRKKQDGVVKLEGITEGRKDMMVEAEIFELAPSLHLIEIKKIAGDSLEFRRIWAKTMRPALKDIILSSQEDGPDDDNLHQQQQQQQQQ